LDITSTVEEVDAPRRIVWGGSDWGTIGIVAGGVLILAGVGGVALVTRRRSTSRNAGAAIGSS
jgi:hypothetical protein